MPRDGPKYEKRGTAASRKSRAGSKAALRPWEWNIATVVGEAASGEGDECEVEVDMGDELVMEYSYATSTDVIIPCDGCIASVDGYPWPPAEPVVKYVQA
jgi:hypothetical protein